MLRTLLVACIALGLIAGCANYRTEKYFETEPQVGKPSTEAIGASDRATVHFFRQRALGQALIYIPIAPLFYAVDGRLTSIMPLGSHVTLSLEPGPHTFSTLAVSGGGLIPVESTRVDTVVNVAAGKTYYVGASNGFPKQSFGLVDEARGREIFSESRPAKFLHQPVDIQTLTQRVADLERKRSQPSGGNAPSEQRSSTANTSSAGVMPSSDQVTQFLEGVATVALALLLVFGAAAGGGSSIGATPAPVYATPSTITQQAPPNVATWRTSNGASTLIVDSAQERSVRVLNTGVTYRIDGNRIYGNDGSRYSKVGTMIYSDGGESYQVIGNFVYTGDGRTCTKTGVIVSCSR